nr:hypothetical protein [Chelatococcus sambhunathii]
MEQRSWRNGAERDVRHARRSMRSRDDVIPDRRAWVSLRDEEGFLPQGLPVDQVTSGKDVLGRQGHEQRLAPQFHDLTSRDWSWAGHEADVEPTPLKAPEIAVALLVLDGDEHIRILSREAAHDLPEKTAERARKGANAQGADRRSPGGRGRNRSQRKLLDRRQDLVEEAPAGIGKADARGPAVEEGHAQPVFHSPHGSADGRLANAKCLRCAPEAAVLGGCRKIPVCGHAAEIAVELRWEAVFGWHGRPHLSKRHAPGGPQDRPVLSSPARGE